MLNSTRLKTNSSVMKNFTTKKLPFLISLFCLFLPISPIFSQSALKAPAMKQSPFYDGVALFFACKGFTVYPEKYTSQNIPPGFMYNQTPAATIQRPQLAPPQLPQVVPNT